MSVIQYIAGILMLIVLLSCKQHDEQRVKALATDSSFVVIKQTAPVFADSCVPMCWPRVFEKEIGSKLYRVFVLSSTIPGDNEWFSNQAFVKKITDSLSYPLLAYLRTLPAQELMPAGATGKITERLRYDVVRQLLSREMNPVSDVGYIQVSQVIVDERSGRGLYVVQQRGTGYLEFLVQIRLQNGRWQFVRKDLMSIS